VIRHFSSASSDHDHTTHELLHDLLLSQVPENSETLRPVALRSTNTQRRLALRPFLLRTWVDHALRHTERLLTVALLIVVVYWLLDGYGRDWLYQFRQQPARAAVSAASAPLSGPHASPALPPTAPDVPARGLHGADLPALPFTTPDMEQTPAAPDYLAPQIVAAPDEPTDLRPQRLVVPTISVDTSVVEVFVQDGAWQVADYAAGYHHGTALPGKTGNTVLAGHAGIRGSVFRDLGQLQIGDAILVEAGGWQYGYRVRAVERVGPLQIEVMAPTPTAVLTLITCTAWDTQRLIVIADLVESRPLT
jgi:sortase A